MVARIRALALLGASATLGCDAIPGLEVAPIGGPTIGYRLVGAYDSSSLRAMETLLPEEERPPPYEYVWTVPHGMQKSCGPVKAPDGLGMFEAEAMANRVLPTLALVLERTQDDAPPLDPHRVRVALGDGTPGYFMEPGVEPRFMEITIRGDVSARYKQQVKTQLSTYMCMEHKTGRAWQGGDGDQVRQALLLNPPDHKLADRKFFGGQSHPVAPLLGPTNACLVRGPGLDSGARDRGLQGDTSLALIPSDVWGASLRWCDTETAGNVYSGPRQIAVTMSKTPESAAPTRPPRWAGLDIKMSAPSDAILDQLVEVTYDGEVMVEEQHLYVELENTPDPGLVDLVSKLPYSYPVVGTESDPTRYTVLMVPNWQIVEGVKRMFAEDYKTPRPNAGLGIQDGVGWLLDHPEYLYVMIPGDIDTYDPRDVDDTRNWVNLAKPMSGGTMGWKNWGYTVGMLAGRSPIALPGTGTPTWDQLAVAQRATQQAVVIAAASTLWLFILAGLVRMRDLWTAVPEERVDFWPGPAADEEGGDDAMGEMAGAGGGEES